MTQEPFFMIYVNGGNTPTHKHDTLENAEREAARLVGRTGNKAFILHPIRCIEPGTSEPTAADQFRQIAVKLGDLYEKKNTAYGNSFGDTYKKLGIISAATRISDKCNRLCNLAKNPDIDNLEESIDDTLRDMANYCIMTLIELQNSKAKGAKCSLTIPYNAKPLATIENLKINKGDKFECIKDVMGYDNKCLYRKGGAYISEHDDCITNLKGYKMQSWTICWVEYFKRVN